ncbi:MAG: hypothetical protein PVI31_08880 [Gemmatimonadota bacterium]
MGHHRWWTALAIACAMLTADAVAAQDLSGARGRDSSDAAGYIGLSFVAGNPLGELDSFFDQSFGVQLEGVWPVSEDRRLRLRTDLGVLVYGHETIAMCHPVGCRIGVDLTTTNNIFFAGVGPEYAFKTGGFEPYVFGTLGLSYFATISSLSGPDDYADYFDTTNYDDIVMAWRFGGGARVRVHSGRHPVSLDFGVERHQNGIANFLTEGDILDNPDGSITLFPNRSEANLMTLRLGVSVGVGG